MSIFSFYARSIIPVCTMAVALIACGSANTAVAADVYEIDPSHTHVQFSIERFGFNDVIGFFPGVKGMVTLDQDAPENSRVEVEIDVASLVSGDATRNQHVTGDFWLNAVEFPMMSFTSTAVTLGSDDTAEVTGDLTLLGHVTPVTLSVKLNKLGTDPSTKGQAAGFSATGMLKRSDFGLETAMGLVGDEVAIRIETLVHKVED